QNVSINIVSLFVSFIIIDLITTKTIVLDRVLRSISSCVDCFLSLFSIIEHITSHVIPICQVTNQIFIQHRLLRFELISIEIHSPEFVHQMLSIFGVLAPKWTKM
ncbi:hypothetical protein PMAYCL1PPCAC_01629, partial [Pristionchus mayeri]